MECSSCPRLGCFLFHLALLKPPPSHKKMLAVVGRHRGVDQKLRVARCDRQADGQTNKHGDGFRHQEVTVGRKIDDNDGLNGQYIEY